MTTLDFSARKKSGQRISMITCYDAAFARIVNASGVDCILIGDSCAMVMHGERTTIPATMDMMAMHTKAVRTGAPDKFIVADMPFLSTRKGAVHAVECAGALLCAGANAVKIEGVFGQEDTLRHIVQSGIPVMAHLGLTPQFYNSLGGHKMQGKTQDAADKIKEEARLAEQCGCFSILLECVPAALAADITRAADVATIGIGAGGKTDGQVLVLQDMLGMSGFCPSFVKKYLDGEALIAGALNQYASEVQSGAFPPPRE
ncbi:MAG: 3-methyl-2-oxobutanoate hydroxymethyltransferase [Treponemataceae bacterium]|nr:3-methyl-2-oxobutanoate hydroxymethyltransferase [Treponemataceae bacterium]